MRKLFNINNSKCVKVLVFSLMLPFIFTVVRAEKIEDTIKENKQEAKEIVEVKVEKATPTNSYLKKGEAQSISEKDDKKNDKKEEDLFSTTTKDILEKIKKEVKENKNFKIVKSKKVQKNLNRNTCDVFLSTLDKSELLDNRINSALIKVNNIELEVEKEFSQRESFLENLKNLFVNNLKEKETEAEYTLYANLQNAKKFYVELDDENKEIIQFLEDNSCDKIKVVIALEKEEQVDLAINREKAYRKTLTSILKDVIEDLKSEISKVEN